jgi:DNA-binding response OmpR family regulator
MAGAAPERVAVLADDLIWATRLADALTTAGAEVTRVRRQGDLEAVLAGGAVRRVVIDLTARAYDGLAAIAAASAAGARVAALGQHDDPEQRRRALAAGAERVFVYRQLFEGGPLKLKAWLEAEA